MENNLIIILIFIIVLIICFFFLNFESNNLEKFTFNAITLHNPDRLENIKAQEKIIPNLQINKFNAIKGIDLNQNELLKNNILSNDFKFDSTKRSNEIGCYLSHLELLKSLRKSSKKYHIILEDDFQFVPDTNFLQIVNNATNQLNTNSNTFDIIFLGWNLSRTESGSGLESESEKITWSENLIKLKATNSFYGTYGYMVNSNSLNKIIDLISQVDMPIDIKYNSLHSLDKLNLYWLNPIVIEPNFGLNSTILT